MNCLKKKLLMIFFSMNRVTDFVSYFRKLI